MNFYSFDTVNKLTIKKGVTRWQSGHNKVREHFQCKTLKFRSNSNNYGKSSMSFSDHIPDLSLHKQSSTFHSKKKKKRKSSNCNVDCFFRPATSMARNVSSIIQRYRRISFSLAPAVSLLTTKLRNSRTAAVTFSHSIMEQPSFSESSFSRFYFFSLGRATSSASPVASASAISTLHSNLSFFTEWELPDKIFVLEG